MRIIRYCLLAALLLLPALCPAQEVLQRDSVKVYFQQGKSKFDPIFKENVWRLSELSNRVKQLQRDSLARIERVQVIGAASPEGSQEVNRRLTHERARSILEYIRPHLQFEEENFEVAFNQLDWVYLESLVRDDAGVPYRDEVLRLIGERDLDGLKKNQASWNYLLKNLFPDMRSTIVAFEYMALEEELRKLEPRVEEPEPQPDTVRQVRSYTPPPMPEDDDLPLDLSEDEPGPSIYLKTNFLLWALLNANLGVEFEIGNHMSFSLPVFYTALNWFRQDAKFRSLGTQPELRFWLFDDFHGPFLGVHGTLSYYNFALSSMDYRIQDRDGRTPAYGGGLDVGWKFRLDRNRADRWGLELSVGYGYLHLDYDRFENIPNGPYVDSGIENYLGPEHASVALTYRFGR